VVRSGLLLRSGSPAAAHASAVEELVGRRGVATVLDLRSPKEAQRDEGARPLGAITIHVNVMDEQLVRNGVCLRLCLCVMNNTPLSETEPRRPPGGQKPQRAFTPSSPYTGARSQLNIFFCVII